MITRCRSRWWIPWWLLRLLRRCGWCWADLVTWKVFKADWPRHHDSCVGILNGCELTCYCGYWDQRRPVEFLTYITPRVRRLATFLRSHDRLVRQPDTDTWSEQDYEDVALAWLVRSARDDYSASHG